MELATVIFYNKLKERKARIYIRIDEMEEADAKKLSDLAKSLTAEVQTHTTKTT